MTSVADPDPGSGAFLTPGSGKNNPDHISESLETIFWVKLLKFFDADPGYGMEKNWIRDKHPGSATLLVTIAPHRFFHKLPYLASSQILAEFAKFNA